MASQARCFLNAQGVAPPSPNRATERYPTSQAPLIA